MNHTADNTEFQSHMQQLERLLRDVESIADPAVREKTTQIIQGLMDFHRAAIARIVDRLSNGGAAEQAIIDDIASDDLASSLLVLYGMHPHDLPTRVRAALEKVRPSLISHGRDVELLSVSEDGVVQLAMTGTAKGCKSTAATLKTSVEQAVVSRAPDVTAIQIKDDSAPAGGFVPVEGLLASAAKLHDLQGVPV
jgi:Fe-S cluster biogenesis protein NfuA